MPRDHVLTIRVRVTDETDEMDVLHGLLMAEGRATVESYLRTTIDDCGGMVHGEYVAEGDVSHIVESMEWDT